MLHVGIYFKRRVKGRLGFLLIVVPSRFPRAIGVRDTWRQAHIPSLGNIQHDILFITTLA